MTGVDVSKMKKHHKSQQKGGDFYTFQEGETLVYLCPPCREGDKWAPTTGLNYVPIVMHYQLGPKKGAAASLDTDINPILSHPFVQKELKKAGKLKKIEGKSCPVAAAMSAGKIDDPDQSRAQTRYLWNIIPLKFRSSKDDDWRELEPKVVPAMISKTLYDGFMEPYYDNGDVSDPDGATLIRVGRKGQKMATKYTVKVEPSTLKKPFVLSSKLKSLMAAAFKGNCDLFQIAAGQFKAPEDVKALLKGLDTTSDPDEDEEDDEAEIEEEEEKPKKKSKKVVEEEEDDEEEESDDDDEDDEDEKPKKKAKKPVDDEEDSDEDEEEKPKNKGAKKPSEDEDEDEDEDEKPKKKSKKKADDDEDSDEEEDVGLKELEKELKSIPDGKKKSKKPVDDDDEEEEDEDDEDDEEEEEKPKKKAKKKAADEDEDDDD
jgi:hypothetical protein